MLLLPLSAAEGHMPSWAMTWCIASMTQITSNKCTVVTFESWDYLHIHPLCTSFYPIKQCPPGHINCSTCRLVWRCFWRRSTHVRGSHEDRGCSTGWQWRALGSRHFWFDVNWRLCYKELMLQDLNIYICNCSTHSYIFLGLTKNSVHRFNQILYLDFTIKFSQRTSAGPNWLTTAANLLGSKVMCRETACKTRWMQVCLRQFYLSQRVYLTIWNKLHW